MSRENHIKPLTGKLDAVLITLEVESSANSTNVSWPTVQDKLVHGSLTRTFGHAWQTEILAR